MKRDNVMSANTIEQRNEIVSQYLWCIDSVMRQNYAKIQAARLEWDDVHQALAVRLIRAVERYDPSKGCSMKHHIFTQLQYELLTCNSPLNKFGIRNAPYSMTSPLVSMDLLMEESPYWESEIAA